MNQDYRFLKACRREAVDCTPVWMMRQAGRYLPEYRAIREKHSFWEMCKIPDVAVEVTLQPLRRMDIDAAILFSDILVPVEAMGVEIEFQEKRGPVILDPVRSKAGVDALHVIQAEEETGYVMEAIKILRGELEGRAPLIGFSGAPFTLASYIIEGGGSRNYQYAKTMMYSEPQLYHELMDKITGSVISYLGAQIDAGAQVVQLFDSWVGCLGASDYKEFAMPYSKRIIDAIKPKGVPIIHFANQASTLFPLVREAGGDVFGVDWRINIDDAWDILGHDVGVQGNLDPVILYGPVEYIEKRVKEILDRVNNRPGHIFNLGHGILPTVPPDNAKAMIDAVHRLSKRAN